jgi:signal transduction histidine kinase
MGPVTEKQAENLEIADQEIDRLSRIISDFLDITKIEADKLTFDCQPQPVQPVIIDAVKLIQPLANNKKVEVITSMPDNELIANIDRDRIIQVLTNLIDNAVRFTPEIGASVTVRVKDLDGEIGIDVEDNGRGIELDDISKVFNRFVQVEKQTGPGTHGTGLGLAISKEIIEIHGGRIWAENLPTGGANFCFTLPKHIDAKVKTNA